MKMRCYVCGKPLDATFYLLSMQEESDRVFVVGSECISRIDSQDMQSCFVTRAK